MACATEGQRRPGAATAADLIGRGLWMRLRPSVPKSAPTIRAAVRLMWAGAAITTIGMLVAIISLADGDRSVASLRLAGHAQPLWLAVAVGLSAGAALIALWLWLARATSEGRSWARYLATVLFGLATLHPFSDKGTFQLLFSLATSLIGLGAIWQLWRPASSAFFAVQTVNGSRDLRAPTAPENDGSPQT
jgi:hypothetical protein